MTPARLDSSRFGRLVSEASFRAALFAQVSVHRLRHMFGIVDDLNDVARAEDDVTAREDAGAGGGTGFIDLDQAFFVRLYARGRAHDLVFRILADGDDGAVGRTQDRISFALNR